MQLPAARGRNGDLAEAPFSLGGRLSSTSGQEDETNLLGSPGGKYPQPEGRWGQAHLGNSRITGLFRRYELPCFPEDPSCVVLMGVTNHPDGYIKLAVVIMPRSLRFGRRLEGQPSCCTCFLWGWRGEPGPSLASPQHAGFAQSHF